MKKLGNTFACLLSMLFFTGLYGQDVEYAGKIISELASEQYYGRGYVNDGDRKAADFIANELLEIGLKPFNKDYKQQYSFPINTFPYKLMVVAAGNLLEPGVDFIVSSASPSVRGTFSLVWLLNDSLFERGQDTRFDDTDLSDKFIVTDKYHKELKKENYFGSKGVIILREDHETLWWHVSNGREVLDFVTLDIKRSKLPEDAGQISLDIRNFYIENHITYNVAAFVPGIVEPDTFIVFTAHYDHLGMMGPEVFFPGANDNASGTAMVLDLARHYATPGNEPYYSFAFITLSGEEAGLHGSRHFADNPLFPLENIKLLVNFDMVGTGSNGIALVNGEIFAGDYERLEALNQEGNYLEQVKQRGESCNSDHCPFYEKGVKAFFIYAMGPGSGAYHSMEDTPANLSLSGYEGIFRLMLDFTRSYQPVTK